MPIQTLTAFFVRVHIDDPAYDQAISGVYAVTAKHTLKKYVDEEASDEAWIRLNKKAGGVDHVVTKIADWRFHDNADVAIYFWPKSHHFDIKPFPIRKHLIDDIIQEWGVGPGDEGISFRLILATRGAYQKCTHHTHRQYCGDAWRQNPHHKLWG